ncbi:MAG: hypothetical protein M3Q30_18315 [Actinomycetota bacterium]|nr:hypothetical protein [Actinomycetota bacterium]
MGTITAEVQVLTAEVRTLQVGSRQVTMSVYRQLDKVDPEWCEPFGRVSDDKNRSPSSYYSRTVYVIGRDVRDGTLVRSEDDQRGTTSWTEPDHLAEWCAHQGFQWKEVSPSWRSGPTPTCRVITDGDLVAKVDIPKPASVKLYGPDGVQRDHNYRYTNDPEGCVYRAEWDFESSGLAYDVLDKQIKDEAIAGIAQLKALRARYDDWRALPLIVLAGLR